MLRSLVQQTERNKFIVYINLYISSSSQALFFCYITWIQSYKMGVYHLKGKASSLSFTWSLSISADSVSATPDHQLLPQQKGSAGSNLHITHTIGFLQLLFTGFHPQVSGFLRNLFQLSTPAVPAQIWSSMCPQLHEHASICYYCLLCLSLQSQTIKSWGQWPYFIHFSILGIKIECQSPRRHSVYKWQVNECRMIALPQMYAHVERISYDERRMD